MRGFNFVPIPSGPMLIFLHGKRLLVTLFTQSEHVIQPAATLCAAFHSTLPHLKKGGRSAPIILRTLRAGYSEKGTQKRTEQQALRTGFRATIEKEDADQRCRICHDRMGLRVYCDLCRKYRLTCVRMCGIRRFQMRREYRKMVCLRFGGIRASRQHSSRVETTQKSDRKWTFVDFLLPWDKIMIANEDEKINNYSLPSGHTTLFQR